MDGLHVSPQPLVPVSSPTASASIGIIHAGQWKGGTAKSPRSQHTVPRRAGQDPVTSLKLSGFARLPISVIDT